MSASMAKQFGDFCGKFIEYDTSIPTLRLQKYLRIRVCLNVAAPLKRKKKVLVGKSMVVYAQFKYEKLSLFRFICGKLGHGESYCPFRLTVDSSKIVFGWDLSLRAVVRCWNMVVSRWLWAADGSTCSEENLAGVKHGNSLNVGKDLGLDSRGFVGNLNPNPNLIPLGSAQIQGVSKSIKGRDGCIDALNSDGLVYGPIEFVLVEENDPIALSDGSMDVSASSDDQSSRAR
ncbi:hypothetical protein Gotur_024146 [Gossypium turneri]